MRLIKIASVEDKLRNAGGTKDPLLVQVCVLEDDRSLQYTPIFDWRRDITPQKGGEAALVNEIDKFVSSGKARALLQKQIREANIRLKDVLFDSDTVTIQLFFNETRESLKFMNYKSEILEVIEELLSSSDIKFVIEYWNRTKNELSTYRFQTGDKK